MYSFIVLGEIPGTEITISFTMWLLLGLLVVAFIASVRVHRNRPHSLELEPNISNE